MSAVGSVSRPQVRGRKQRCAQGRLAAAMALRAASSRSRQHAATQRLARSPRAESERKAAELARHETEIELQRARLLQVQLELATGDMAKARSLLLLPVDPSLEEEWHWRAWEYSRKSRIVNRVDLTPAGEVLTPAYVRTAMDA